ncbi:MAG: tRNA (adenosine(37)-N6)-threonylcarbamoyltransferase complex ATPase subunit type 1 TsaE [Gammaproteobacteria bacterium]|nr:tRNA (adenosine(37)-N6)-threonylcarbamoyltransferase complex ATPase subunit type 1 TsaE [Gammaproteobacteria bacterium]
MRDVMFDIHGEAQQLKFGQQLATCVDDKACIIFLQGELGAGKTTLVRGFLSAMGYAGKVKSPTYTLVETYDCPPMTVVHMDLYRLKDPHEIEHLNLRDYLDQKTIIVIEWPEKALAKLPSPDITCALSFHGENRQIKFTSHTTTGQNILEALKKI